MKNIQNIWIVHNSQINWSKTIDFCVRIAFDIVNCLFHCTFNNIFVVYLEYLFIF